MELIKIADRSYVFTYSYPEWDLNLHLIEADKHNFVIDTGVGTGSVAPILDRLKQRKKPVIVINTHHHWDHVWGNSAFEGCFIISHRLCRQITDCEWEEQTDKLKEYISGHAQKLLPNLTFEDSLYFPDDGIRLFYTPGHTEDSISVFDERDCVLNAGDNIGDTMEEIVPNLDCDKEIYIETLLKYKALDFSLCVSGHNSIQGKDIVDNILAAI